MLSARHLYNRSFLLNYRKPNFTRTSVGRLSLTLRNVRIRYSNGLRRRGVQQ